MELLNHVVAPKICDMHLHRGYVSDRYDKCSRTAYIYIYIYIYITAQHTLVFPHSKIYI
jgi:hypothetical protein